MIKHCLAALAAIALLAVVASFVFVVFLFPELIVIPFVGILWYAAYLVFLDYFEENY